MNFKHKKKEIIYLNKDELELLEGNPRKKKDPEAEEKLRNQIIKHDFQNPLNVWKDKSRVGKYIILAGNHRFRAVKDLMTEFPCIVYCGTKKEAIARSIADNKSNEWTDFDIPVLKDIFAELDDGDFDMSMTAFELDDINALFENIPTINEKPQFEDKDPLLTWQLWLPASKSKDFAKELDKFLLQHEFVICKK